MLLYVHWRIFRFNLIWISVSIAFGIFLNHSIFLFPGPLSSHLYISKEEYREPSCCVPAWSVSQNPGGQRLTVGYFPAQWFGIQENIAFKKTCRNKKALTGLLSYLLDVPAEQITDIGFPDTFLHGDHEDDLGFDLNRDAGFSAWSGWWTTGTAVFTVVNWAFLCYT